MFGGHLDNHSLAGELRSGVFLSGDLRQNLSALGMVDGSTQCARNGTTDFVEPIWSAEIAAKRSVASSVRL